MAKVEEYKKWVNGQLIEQSRLAPKATPESSDAGAGAGAQIINCDNEPPGCTAYAFYAGTIFFVLEPEQGEQAGDPVTFCTEWTGSVSTSAAANAAAAAASGGGDATPSSSAPNSAGASTSAPAFVLTTGGNTYNLGQLSITAPPPDSDNEQNTQELVVQIGADVTISVAAAAAAATPPGGNAQAEASSSLNLTQGACPVLPASIPTLSAVALAVFIGLLGLVLVFFTCRNGQRSP